MFEKLRTRKEYLEGVRKYIKSLKHNNKKIEKVAKQKAIELFNEYYSENDIFILYKHSNGYILIYSEICFDEMVYNILLTTKDVDVIECEIDFDNIESFKSYINDLHLTL